MLMLLFLPPSTPRGEWAVAAIPFVPMGQFGDVEVPSPLTDTSWWGTRRHQSWGLDTEGTRLQDVRWLFLKDMRLAG